MKAERLIFRNRLGRTLKIVREAHGLSQSQLADKMATTRQQVCDIERGEQLPTMDTLGRACTALEISLSTLMQLAEADGGEGISEAA
jgi:transcriptional regulator with XRE-family HTH domain